MATEIDIDLLISLVHERPELWDRTSEVYKDKSKTRDCSHIFACNLKTAREKNCQLQEVDNMYLMLDPQLHPIPPDSACSQSMQIFEEHKQLAHEYLEVQTKMAYLQNHMKDLAERLSVTEQQQEDEEIKKLENEKESLLQLHRNLKVQLEYLKPRKVDRSQNIDGWEVVPHPT